MSNFTALVEVGRTLRSLLWTEFQREPQVLSIVGELANIVLTDPARKSTTISPRLSLWVYRLTENEFVKNQPPAPLPNPRGGGGSTIRNSGLCLNLHLLITPLTGEGEKDLLLLGKTMQILHDNARILLTPADQDVSEELKVVLCPLTLEELTRVWDALREPYKLSVCYEIRLVSIESRIQRQVAHVTRKEFATRDAAIPITNGGGGGVRP